MIKYEELRTLLYNATNVDITNMVSHTGNTKHAIQIIANVITSQPASLKLTDKVFRNGFEYAVIHVLKLLCRAYAEDLDEITPVERAPSLRNRLIKIISPSKKEVTKLRDI